MIRVRFKVHVDDYRPINWPIKHPYWCSAEGDDEIGEFFILIAYADDEAEVLQNWPEAVEIDSEECDSYTFTDRFPKPEWFNPI